MRYSSTLPACVLLLGLAALTLPGGPGRAQNALVPRPTFAQALAALEPPRQDLFLAVGADKVALPPAVPPPDPTDRPAQVGGTYGRVARDFGGVTALALPTMVVLNTHPGVPDPYDGMPPDEALKLLTAGLSPPQWNALTGESGLGVADLSDDTQRGLFRQVLPSQDLLIPVRHSEPVTLAARDLDTARLRLGRAMTIDVPMVGPGGDGEGSLTPPISGVAVSDTYPIPGTVPGPVYGAVLRQVLPNSPKDADLDYTAAALKRSVRVDGVVTVGDLVARVGRAARLELYADRRYETRRITLVGRRTARCVDLLRATAFCVTGTFRRVGPAYVLTDDLEGTATRRGHLGRFLQEAQLKGTAAREEASDSLAAAHGGADALPWLGGAGLSDAQRALPVSSLTGLTVTFAQLTPAQQDLALGLGGVDRDRPFRLRARIRLLLLSPAAPGPVFLDYLSSLDGLFQPSIGSQLKADIQRTREASRRNLPRTRLRPISPPALAALLTPFPRRSVLAAPRTAGEVDAVVTEMKALGLNQLWLEVFSGGHSRLGAPGKPDILKPDILTEALARAKGTGIAVIPALDLLRWGRDAPAGALDLTALGETSAERQTWQEAWSLDYSRATSEMPHKPPAHAVPADVWACPAAPVVETTLLTLVRRLAATPGVTTLALCGTAPPGGDLGYVPALRLALLRRDHMDPLDLDWTTTIGYGVDTSVAGFDDAQDAQAAAPLRQVEQDWGHLRDAASRDLLRHLLGAAQGTGGRRFRFLVRQRGDPSRQTWYGLWESPQAPLPAVPVAAPGSPIPPWETDYAPVAHSQCRINLVASGLWAAGPYAPAVTLQKLSSGWDGVVLDATNPWDEESLARLARGVKR